MKVDDADLVGKTAYMGLDLSTTIDLTSLVAIIPHNDMLVMRAWNWLPEEGLLEREQRERVPYRQWAKDGRLELTPGNAIDLQFITDRVQQIASGYDVSTDFIRSLGQHRCISIAHRCRANDGPIWSGFRFNVGAHEGATDPHSS